MGEGPPVSVLRRCPQSACDEQVDDAELACSDELAASTTAHHVRPCGASAPPSATSTTSRSTRMVRAIEAVVDDVRAATTRFTMCRGAHPARHARALLCDRASASACERSRCLILVSFRWTYGYRRSRESWSLTLVAEPPADVPDERGRHGRALATAPALRESMRPRWRSRTSRRHARRSTC